MRQQGLKVIVATEGQQKDIDSFKSIATSASPTTSLLVARNILSTELVKIITPITRGTNMSANIIVDKIISDYPLGQFHTDTDLGMVYSIIFNEVYKVALESTAITGIDHANHINSVDHVLKSTCELVVTLVKNSRVRDKRGL